MIIEASELTDDILDKKLIDIIDQTERRSSNKKTAFDHGFIITGYEYITPSTPHKESHSIKNEYHGPCVVLRNQHGMNLRCKNLPGVLLQIE